MKIRMRFAAAALGVWLAQCGLGPGSGTETTNGQELTGRVFYPDGKAATAAVILLRRDDYVRDTSALDTNAVINAETDGLGYFRVDSLIPGAYKLEARDGNGLALLREVTLEPKTKKLELPADTLRPIGVLRGQAELPPGASAPAYVQIFGMERLTRSDSLGFFSFTDLPAGQYQFRALSPAPGFAYPQPSIAAITPGDTAVASLLTIVAFDAEDYSQWPFSQRIFLNTAAAGVAGNAVDFPLLVKLDASVFDFSLSDGKDLRFADSAGRHLAYQLDHWDPLAGSAAAWVKMDTVSGNSQSQSITLHWGKRDAPDFSNGNKVFSSFAGAWHFSEAVNGQGTGQFRDASPSASDGTAKVAANDRYGAIGPGAGFAGTHSVAAQGAAAMKPARSLTVSAWVHATGTGSLGGEIASMGDNYGLRVHYDGGAYFFVYTDTTRKSNTRTPEPYWPFCNSSGIDLRNTGWHHVAGLYDGQTMRLFVDGAEKNTQSVAQDLVYPFGKEFRMGIHGNEAFNVTGYAFRGEMDEVQVGGLRTPDWIKLSFENQKAGSVLLEFR